MSSTFRILGLHHVTATVDDAQADLDFCLRGLGLRLVKKTVNFDNHHVFHFYYGDESGTPGTIWTTFPYKGHGVRTGVHGAGQITSTAFSVPKGSLAWWKDRFDAMGARVDYEAPRFGDDVLSVVDPSGLIVDLVASDRDTRVPWTRGGVEAAHAVRGLHDVTFSVRSPAVTVDFLADLLGFHVVGETHDRTRLAVNGNAPGHTIDVLDAREAPAALNGLGTVHHVALAVPDAEEQLRIREAVVAKGIQVTRVLDRQYFTSIYFREPGGVLLEIATAGPGFTVDEDREDLGRGLKLPPWEEPHRSIIESGLPPVHSA
jgi:glyoxalase family protein